MRLEDIVIILVKPGEAGNIGAACRAMKNMGLIRLRLVSPQGGGLNQEVIRTRAVHAADLWDHAEIFETLPEAAADCSLVIGTTRRRGHRRKAHTLPPVALARFLKKQNGRAALVFGNERTGLEDGELACCSLASHIPADSAFPSLNLSHAVQIYCYELYRNLTPSAGEAVAGQWIPLDQTGIRDLTLQVTNSLESLGFYKQRGRQDQECFFRDIFSRAGITEGEARYMRDIFAKAARLALKGTS
ncbi:MAG: TrmJ/YjtD family RNA methyltransferase [Treponema sp.]|jgi:tRNA/rRNA methyltransferase/tRNA (cytidine32/uridine32-2'-O)-methyltransferase|nr:TrmJ/YjtD family RNA methyltransferase [Treponema sp.]